MTKKQQKEMQKDTTSNSKIKESPVSDSTLQSPVVTSRLYTTLEFNCISRNLDYTDYCFYCDELNFYPVTPGAYHKLWEAFDEDMIDRISD